MCHLPRRDRCRKVPMLESTRRHIGERARIDRPGVQGFNVAAELQERSLRGRRAATPATLSLCYADNVIV